MEQQEGTLPEHVALDYAKCTIRELIKENAKLSAQVHHLEIKRRSLMAINNELASKKCDAGSCCKYRSVDAMVRLACGHQFCMPDYGRLVRCCFTNTDITCECPVPSCGVISVVSCLGPK